MNPIIRGLSLAGRRRPAAPMNRAARREQQRAEQRIQRQQRRQAQRTGETPIYERERMQRDATSRQVLEAQRRQPSPIQRLKEAQVTRDEDMASRIARVQKISKARVINTPDPEARKAILSGFDAEDWKQFVEEYEERWERWDSRNEMEPMGSPEAVEDFVDSF